MYSNSSLNCVIIPSPIDATVVTLQNALFDTLLSEKIIHRHSISRISSRPFKPHHVIFRQTRTPFRYSLSLLNQVSTGMWYKNLMEAKISILLEVGKKTRLHFYCICPMVSTCQLYRTLAAFPNLSNHISSNIQLSLAFYLHYSARLSYPA